MPDRDLPVALTDGYSMTSLGIIVVSANEVPTGRTMYRRLRRQGRGMAELREPQMLNANKAVKIALKRAQVDAVLRCAGLSQWFTQDLEEPPTSRRVPRRTMRQPGPQRADDDRHVDRAGCDVLGA